MDSSTVTFFDFVEKHINDDCSKLLLHRDRYPEVDIAGAVQQIEGRREAAVKWPSLASRCSFLFPPRLNREQSSSESTAKYKTVITAPLLPSSATGSIADLTGGMGIDSMALAKSENVKLDYVEMDTGLCHLMEHNVKALGFSNITVHNADSMQWLAVNSHHFDLIFIDPARRDKGGRKVAAFEDCTPNILAQMPMLMDHCSNLIIKASPMVDISLAIAQLGNVMAVHIVAVKGECKELLFVCNHEHRGEPVISCHNIGNGLAPFRFLRSEEELTPHFFAEPADYIFEPDATLMKAGAFHTVCSHWNIAKLDRNTHLYTGRTPLPDFRGRQFRILEPLKLNKKSIAAAIPSGKAHVITRNFPIAATELQKQLGLQEGGELFVIATRSGNRTIGLLCEKVEMEGETSY